MAISREVAIPREVAISGDGYREVDIPEGGYAERLVYKDVAMQRGDNTGRWLYREVPEDSYAERWLSWKVAIERSGYTGRWR